MKRKIIKLGSSTLVVSLPNHWAKKNELRQGDQINIIEGYNNELFVYNEKNKNDKNEFIIDLNKITKKNIKIILTHIYRLNYNKIKIENIKNKDIEEIKKITQNLLLGFEITSQNKSSCTIENIAEPNKEKYNILFRKTFLIVKEIQNIILDDIEKNKYNNLLTISNLKDQQDKFVFYCKRTMIIQSHSKTLFEWELLKNIMLISHSYYYLYEYLSKNKFENDKNFILHFKELINYFELFYEAYFNKKINNIDQINKLKDELHQKKTIELMNKGKNIVLYSYIRETFRLIQISTSPIQSILLSKTDFEY
ncbi:hypothetical protein HOC99_02580 [Candidatus Woesearchaeota archaeon]|jgi:phosphate uptake regulator|nr:hypothetical protein [Candidatus Woesearchaeota archaeon]MBT4595795.1 hypothetical protein [Candidatus Woesearchaeota archaeon]MBT5741356.1 hypothetical protein [Candidatus Woesearchaeota archaeon]MBT7848853.1 hypothetical protein [Candidatus Woesearchaeota archaeon]MBT7962135.1 hypothetical protein [Candidatus Woesearchaeota archaeon]